VIVSGVDLYWFARGLVRKDLGPEQRDVVEVDDVVNAREDAANPPILEDRSSGLMRKKWR
jgi:hypothetical protein